MLPRDSLSKLLLVNRRENLSPSGSEVVISAALALEILPRLDFSVNKMQLDKDCYGPLRFTESSKLE